MFYKKKVNVLYIITKLELGGAQKVCISLIKGIKKLGGFAGLVSGDKGPLVKDVQNLNSVFLLKDFKREIGFKNLFKDIKLFFKLIVLIRKIKKKYPDLIIHTHSTKAGIVGRWAGFFAGVKKRVHTVHGFGFHEHQNKLSWLFIYLMEFFTAFITTHYICVSAYDVDIGSRLLPFFKKNNSLIRAAVEYDKFYIPAKSVKPFSDAKFILGTVSCFKPQKNLIDLLKAFKKIINDLSLKKDKLILQMIGDGILREDLKKWVDQNNLQNNVEFLGWQSDVSKWIKNWNLFVMSSLWEGLPCAIVEARLSRLPVVAYNISGIPEVIINNKNGFLVKPGDWKTLAEKIKFFILNEKDYIKISNHNDDLFDFHEKNMIKNHVSLYRGLFRQQKMF
ncbi:glycosyltransferase [Candidatus Dependentiae bacterium]|nr:glycosyltransferase [Candidatus Dependentiae bacterium]